jgi:hypothetical protein
MGLVWSHVVVIEALILVSDTTTGRYSVKEIKLVAVPLSRLRLDNRNAR